MLVPGFNHDIPHAGTIFHVQTEQSSAEGAPRIVTEIYKQGQIVACHRSQPEIECHSKEYRNQLVVQVRRQHKRAIQCVLRGEAARLGECLPQVRNESAIREARPQASRPPSAGLPKMGRVVPRHSASMDLGLRKALIRFVRSVGEEAPESLEAIHRRLQSVMASLAVLRNDGRDRFLRQGDLAELVMKQSETTDYFRRGPSTDAELGLGLWNSFYDLGRTFLAVNQRSILRAHDLEALQRVVANWASLENLSQEPDSVALALLKSCWGRDMVLDEKLDDLRDLSVETLYPVVTRIIADLALSGAGEDGSPASDAEGKSSESEPTAELVSVS